MVARTIPAIAASLEIDVLGCPANRAKEDSSELVDKKPSSQSLSDPSEYPSDKETGTANHGVFQLGLCRMMAHDSSLAALEQHD
jgi:hypothetical protein